MFLNILDLKNKIYSIFKRNNMDPSVEGTVVKTLVDTEIEIISNFSRTVENLESQNDWTTATGLNLEKWGLRFGVTRNDYLYALDISESNTYINLNTTFSSIISTHGLSVDSIYIPAGLNLYTSAGSIFVTMDPITIDSSTTKKYIKVASVLINESSVVASNSFVSTNISEHLPTYSFLSEYIVVGNDSEIAIMHDFDTDEDLRTLITTRFVASAGSNRSTLKAWIHSIPGVTFVNIGPIPKSPHVEDIYIIPKTAQLKQAITEVINDRVSDILPIGTAVRISFPQYHVVSTTIKWKRKSTDTFNENDLKNVIMSSINSLRKGDSLSIDILQLTLNNYTNRADVTVSELFFGYFDDKFNVKNLLGSYNTKTLGLKDLFYIEDNLIKVIEV